MKEKRNSDGKILCWGCGEEGHLRPYCPDPKKPNNNPKKTQESSKPKAKVATASVVEINSDDEGAWASEEVKLKVGKDWFDEIVEEELLKEKNDNLVEDVEFKLIEDIEEEIGEEVIEEAFGDVSGEAFVVAKTVQTLAKTKLYNSGCMNHISPYKSDFNNFQTIKTRHFCTANKQIFSTIGKGELVVNIPNDSGTMQFRLQEVLYSPEVSYTLVSIGRLDEDGFSMTFGGGRCTIRDVNKEVVGVIPKTAVRVYKVEHEEIASGAEERLSLGSFHHQMGHISPDMARKLVEMQMGKNVREHYVGAYHILTFSILLPPSMVYEQLLVVSECSLVLHPCASPGRYHILYLLSLSYLLSRPRVVTRVYKVAGVVCRRHLYINLVTGDLVSH